MEDNNNTPEKDENAFEDPIKKDLNEPAFPNVPEVSINPVPPTPSVSFGAPRIDLSLLNSKVGTARTEIGKYLIGQHEMVDLLLIGLFCGGQVLLEGVPGIAYRKSSCKNPFCRFF